jgi:ketosteroid isomerase-like protein
VPILNSPLPRFVKVSPFILMAALCLGGCSGEKNFRPKADSSGPTLYESELMEADRLFSNQVAAVNPADRANTWAKWFTPSGRQIVAGKVVQGSPSVADLMNGAFTSPGYSLTWEPDMASASQDGTLGWTTGRYESRGGEPGQETIARGRYLTIWRRLEDGSWKVAVDTGVPDPVEK